VAIDLVAFLWPLSLEAARSAAFAGGDAV